MDILKAFAYMPYDRNLLCWPIYLPDKVVVMLYMPDNNICHGGIFFSLLDHSASRVSNSVNTQLTEPLQSSQGCYDG